ncbi:MULTISPECIES: hypothetical protein [Saccharothrix]|uniref:hypothetical protein n=1 Tax=Saccharothrix TaxID=2071 RepID=UPI0013011CD0|nr:hypothetical protein [Saccharothrix sp. CB00851]
MTTITMTSSTTPSATRTVVRASAPVTTAARFVGHLLAALVGVAILGRDLEH